MWFVYQVAMVTTLLLAGPFLLLRRGRHYLTTLAGRMTRAPLGAPTPGALWVHAVSVGEVAVAATLLDALAPRGPLVVTTVTPTGQARARSLFGQRGRVTYLPFDLGGPVHRFLTHFSPRGLILVEGDLWPLLLARLRCRTATAPIVVVNGRVSDRGAGRLDRLRRHAGWLYRRFVTATFGKVDAWGVQSEGDAERLRRLGVAAERITVTGNLKYESREPPEKPALANTLARMASGRPILVAGSTMSGEEEIVLDGLAAINVAGNGPTADAQPESPALLVLAPRHPERFTAVAELLARRGFTWARRTHFPDDASLEATSQSRQSASQRVDVVLLDSLGELASLYRLAHGAFIGGTLVPKGGHNPLEAARHGTPVAVGPAMDNFRAMAEDFDRRQAWARVTSGAELGRLWRSWLADPAAARQLGERGRALLAENRGALAATLTLLARHGLADLPESAPTTTHDSAPTR